MVMPGNGFDFRPTPIQVGNPEQLVTDALKADTNHDGLTGDEVSKELLKVREQLQRPQPGSVLGALSEEERFWQRAGKIVDRFGGRVGEEDLKKAVDVLNTDFSDAYADALLDTIAPPKAHAGNIQEIIKELEYKNGAPLSEPPSSGILGTPAFEATG